MRTLQAVGRLTVWVSVLLVAWFPLGASGGCPPPEPISGGATLVTWIPSEAAPGRGIVVRISYPDSPRYPEGTAAVVIVPGADSSGGVGLQGPERDPYLPQGLVRVSFAFPGGGKPPYQSSGTYDHRGLDSLRALRDVVRFLQGEIPEENGCFISDILPYSLLQVGLTGYSNGGNTAVVALGLFGDEMGVDWYVGWENPAGVQFTTVDLGSRNQSLPFYTPCSCRLTPDGAKCDIDYTHLAWDGGAVSRGWGPQGRDTRGVLFYDLDGNGRYDPGDYVLGAYPGTFDGTEKRVYSTSILEAAVERGLIDPWPEGVATLDEARDYWALRDMSRYYDDAIARLPRPAAIVIGSETDHVQATPDHPHILLQYLGWQEAGIPWVRINPDASYVELFHPRGDQPVEAPAGSEFDCHSIASVLEPETIPDSLTQAASALELADRTYLGDWSADLSAPLVEGPAPGSPAPSAPESSLNLPHSVERLPDGNTLICDGGSAPLTPKSHPQGGSVILVGESGIAWRYTNGLSFPHDAELDDADEHLLIADTGNNRVIELELATGRISWSTEDLTLSDGSSLDYPNDADYLPDGNILITDRNNHRLIVIDRSGKVIWQFGETGQPGADSHHLNHPHNADLLPSGHILVADSENDRVLEISQVGEIVWTYAQGLNWPRDADRLPNGNTLITDSKNNRVIEVTPQGEIVWEYSWGLRLPYEADRLPSGNTLIADSRNRRVIEVSSTGEVVWSYPSEPTS